MDLLKNPQKYKKFYVSLLGALITWAIATFPESRDIQLYGSLISAIITGASTYQVTNQE